MSQSFASARATTASLTVLPSPQVVRAGLNVQIASPKVAQQLKVTSGALVLSVSFS